MPEPKVYLLRIMEGQRCVAEAPLIIYDKAAAQRCWLEGFGQIAQGIVGATFQMMMVACDEREPVVPVVGISLEGAHTGLHIVRQMPPNNDHKPTDKGLA